MRSNQGMTLLEVLIALFVFTIAVLATIDLQRTSLQTTYGARVTKAATAVIRDKIERIRAQPGELDNLCKDSEQINGFDVSCAKTPCAIKVQDNGNGNVTTVSCDNVGVPDLYKIQISVKKGGLKKALT